MLSGKGIFIWIVRETMDGNPQTIAEAVRKAGMTHAWIKIADGSGRYNVTNGKDAARELISALRERGISPWGWQYVYGRYPDYEASMAISRIKELGVDGFVVNAEGEYKSAGAGNARRYMGLLRAAFPKLPIGLSSYRFPSYHREFPFDAFLSFCDFNAPQVYWVGADNPDWQLEECVRQFRTLVSVQRPVFPTGAAYHERGWQPTAEQVVAFMRKARELGLDGFNFWEMGNCLRYLPGVWQEIEVFPWGAPVVDPEAPGTGDPGDALPIEILQARVVSDVVTVRTGPGTRFPEKRRLTKGAVVNILDIRGSDAWIQIGQNPNLFIAAFYGNKRYVELLRND